MWISIIEILCGLAFFIITGPFVVSLFRAPRR
jgi:hypothetical protein